MEASTENPKLTLPRWTSALPPRKLTAGGPQHDGPFKNGNSWYLYQISGVYHFSPFLIPPRLHMPTDSNLRRTRRLDRSETRSTRGRMDREKTRGEAIEATKCPM